MSRKRAVLAILGAGGLALAISQPLDAEARLSVRLWIALTAGALGVLLLNQLLQELPVPGGPSPVAAFRRWLARRRRIEPSGTATGLRAAAGLVARSTENVRTHNTQLRPRLTELADQVVPRRAVGPDARIRELIQAAGDTGWLIDPTIADRTPTIDDIDRFLDRMLDADPSTPAPAVTTPNR